MGSICNAAAAVLLLFTGCQVNSEKAIKLQGQAGRMNRNNDYAWYAICKTETPGGHQGVWKGLSWQAKERAMQDAADHNRQYPGHQAIVDHD